MYRPFSRCVIDGGDNVRRIALSDRNIDYSSTRIGRLFDAIGDIGTKPLPAAFNTYSAMRFASGATLTTLPATTL